MTDNIIQQHKLENYLREYSFDDLATCFFALNLWLPNIACPVKIQYLYVILETIHDNLSPCNNINSYEDFTAFCKGLFELLPSFVFLEDYIPEPDWGNIKYFFQNRLYKIFYGGDLSNPYDFYYAYEIIHESFLQEYLELLGRSPITEMQFCLELQDYIISSLNNNEATDNIAPGDIGVPPEYFWMNAHEFIKQYSPENYHNLDRLALYTKELTEPVPLPSMDSFIENAYRGQNCRYFFIRKGTRYYPAMPRKWLTVVYDTWGTLLKDNCANIIRELGGKEPNIMTGARLAHFIRERINNGNIFPLVRSINPDLSLAHDLTFTAVLDEDRIFLIYVTPPFFNRDDLHKHLQEIQPKLKESSYLLSQPPNRLGLIAENKVVEFRLTNVNIRFLIVLPSPLSYTEGGIEAPKDIEAEIMTLDQIAGIFDEIIKVKELNDFFDYIASERKLARITPMNSYLDKFGSFKDSFGVLVPGAIEPNNIWLAGGYGSNFRFESLKKFWSIFPETSFYGHPRSWTIPPEKVTKTGFVISNKTFFGYAYYQNVGNTSFFINAPVHRMELKDGELNDSVMYSLSDAIEIYAPLLSKLNPFKSHYMVHVFFCPASLAQKENELAHVRHLVQDRDLWEIDCARLEPDKYGIRVVYNQDILFEALKDASDRSVQVQLLIDVFAQLNALLPDSIFSDIRIELEKEKCKKARFKTFAVEGTASFPEGIKATQPGEKEHKLANKEIAKLALELSIQPGIYTFKEGVIKLNALRSSVVRDLNSMISAYSLLDAVPVLLEKASALMHDSIHDKAHVKASQDQDIDYERSERSSKSENDFLHWYRVYRYLIEKFVHLQPKGNTELNDQNLRLLLALANRLIDLYTASDFITYKLLPVNVHISNDYLVSTIYDNIDTENMQKEYGEEQEKLNLGIIGNKDDMVTSSFTLSDYLDKLDCAFYEDFGFGFKNFINLQQVLSRWAAFADKSEATYYHAGLEEISAVCEKQIQGYIASETKAILHFLTLDPTEVLAIKDDPREADDVPIWEHNKRHMRFDIRPLIILGGQYYWGPYSIYRTCGIWLGILNKHKLPSSLDATNVKRSLKEGHLDLENSLVIKIKGIISRYTDQIKLEVYPHKIDDSIVDIGDYDILAYLKDSNTLLNIESKVIDPPHCNKDAGRIQRQIFGENKEAGTFEKGHLQKVEEREAYLQANGRAFMAKLCLGTTDSAPRVVSIFVTKIGFLWTKYPPIKTDVHFVEIRLLDDFIKGLVA